MITSFVWFWGDNIIHPWHNEANTFSLEILWYQFLPMYLEDVNRRDSLVLPDMRNFRNCIDVFWFSLRVHNKQPEEIGRHLLSEYLMAEDWILHIQNQLIFKCKRNNVFIDIWWFKMYRKNFAHSFFEFDLIVLFINFINTLNIYRQNYRSNDASKTQIVK